MLVRARATILRGLTVEMTNRELLKAKGNEDDTDITAA
jgi:hypothetical protein